MPRERVWTDVERLKHVVWGKDVHVQEIEFSDDTNLNVTFAWGESPSRSLTLILPDEYPRGEYTVLWTNGDADVVQAKEDLVETVKAVLAKTSQVEQKVRSPPPDHDVSLHDSTDEDYAFEEDDTSGDDDEDDEDDDDDEARFALIEEDDREPTSFAGPIVSGLDPEELEEWKTILTRHLESVKASSTSAGVFYHDILEEYRIRLTLDTSFLNGFASWVWGLKRDHRMVVEIVLPWTYVGCTQPPTVKSVFQWDGDGGDECLSYEHVRAPHLVGLSKDKGVLEWFLANRLEACFRKNWQQHTKTSRQRVVGVKIQEKGGVNESHTPQAENVSDEALARLMSLGFRIEPALEALRRTENNVGEARTLLSRMPGSRDEPSPRLHDEHWRPQIMGFSEWYQPYTYADRESRESPRDDDDDDDDDDDNAFPMPFSESMRRPSPHTHNYVPGWHQPRTHDEISELMHRHAFRAPARLGYFGADEIFGGPMRGRGSVKKRKDPSDLFADTGNFLVNICEFLNNGLRSLCTHCIICDKKLEYDGFKPTVCLEASCLRQMHEYGLGYDLQTELKRNAEVVDLLLCVTVAAASTSQRLLEPRPTELMADRTTALSSPLTHPCPCRRGLEVDDIIRILQAVPPVTGLSAAPVLSEEMKDLDDRTLPLLHWILASNRSQICPIPENKRLQIDTPHQFLFVTGDPVREKRFQEMKASVGERSGGRGSFYLFYGSPLSHWHSILRTKLEDSSTPDIIAPRSGIHLTKYLNLSIGHPRLEGCWAHSMFRKSVDTPIALVAVCEVIADRHGNTGETVVVHNADMVCTRFLLVLTGHRQWPAASAESLHISDDLMAVQLINNEINQLIQELQGWESRKRDQGAR